MDISNQPHAPVRFGVFEVDFTAGELRKNGLRLRLPAQPFQVLAILLERPGEVVTREELRERLWPSDTFVDFDHSLSTAINKIREALSDSAENPRFVETRPRRGYRFIAPVAAIEGARRLSAQQDVVSQEAKATEEGSQETGGPLKSAPGVLRTRALAAVALLAVVAGLAYFVFLRSRITSARRFPEKIRLVVLPFQNLSGDPNQDFFSAGLTDELITQLGSLNPNKLGVIASTSSNLIRNKPISEIAQAFHVQYVIEGSVRRSSNEARIDVQLIQASDETHLWASSFTRDLSDILRAQSEVSEAVVRQIPANLHLAPAASPHTLNPQAHDAYLKGKFYLDNRSDLLKSVALFEEATRLDPGYAPGFAALAHAYNLLGETPYSLVIPRDAYEKSVAAANRALELDGSLADAHAALGMGAFSFVWDLRAAEREYRLALELDPNNASAHEWLGEVYAVQRKTKEALEEGQRSLDLDPVSPACHAFIAYTYYFAGDYDKSAEESRRILDIQPQFLQARYWLGSAYVQKKMYREAIEQFRLGRQLSGDSPVMVTGYAYAQAMSGNSSEAQAALRNLQERSRNQYISPIYFAGIYNALGDKTNTYKFLDLAFDERNDRMPWLNVDPVVNPIRHEARFQELLRRINAHTIPSATSQ